MQSGTEKHLFRVESQESSVIITHASNRVLLFITQFRVGISCVILNIKM